MENRIRTIAVAICRAGDRVLLERGYDRHSDHHFYRAIGGGVEFGESAADAVVREWREEYDVTLKALALLGVLENRFTFEEKAGHEVVFVFEGEVSDPRAHESAEFAATDTDGVPHVADWVSLDALATGAPPLYPVGMLELLMRKD